MANKVITNLEDARQALDLKASQKLNAKEWNRLSAMPLSEAFIEQYVNKVDWSCISRYQHLNEAFIERHADKVNRWRISVYQHLSEDFIARHADGVDWGFISTYQQLSEAFIERYADRVSWYCISEYQHLSEDFIARHADEVDWGFISIFQRLSENFIERHADKVVWSYISRYQHLSKPFRKRHILPLPEYNYMSWTTQQKKDAVMQTGLYECCDDYFIAYKGIRQDRYSAFNFQYQYLPGETYTTHADYTDSEDSFGFSAWTEEKAREYCDELVVRVKVYYKDVARVVHDGGKIRCCRMTVLD